MKLDVDDGACNAVVKDGEIPEKWNGSWMVNVYKGIVLHRLCGSYITLHYRHFTRHSHLKQSVVLQQNYR